MSRAPRRAPTEALLREIVDMHPASLVPNPRNPRKHPDEQIDRLVDSLRAHGQTKPLVARRENHMMIAGHGVLKAIGRLGWETVNVVLMDIDQPTADRIMLGDNRHSDLSSPDEERAAELLREIDEIDWLSVGYSPDEGKKLLADLDTEPLVVREIETSTVADTFWISVRGPLVEQAEALQRIKALMGDMPQLTIVLGTTDSLV
jgi:ParB-like chromosome segregation protein Spo0J